MPRRTDFSENERQFQEAQNHWAEFKDKASYDIMFNLIQQACFNNINKKLEYVVDRETIEGYSLDITMNILRSINNKIAKGKEWKIGKLSSFVHLPCLAIYRKQNQFEDACLSYDEAIETGEYGDE